MNLVQKTIQDRRNSGISETLEDVDDVLLNDENEQLTDDLIANNIIEIMIPRENSMPIFITLAIKYLLECLVALQQLMVSHCLFK